MYLIFRCKRCGRHLYVEEGTRTRTCPCGNRIKVKNAKIITELKDERDAGEMVRRLQLGNREMTGFSPAG